MWPNGGIYLVNHACLPLTNISKPCSLDSWILFLVLHWVPLWVHGFLFLITVMNFIVTLDSIWCLRLVSPFGVPIWCSNLVSYCRQHPDSTLVWIGWSPWCLSCPSYSLLGWEVSAWMIMLLVEECRIMSQCVTWFCRVSYVSCCVICVMQC